MKKIYIFASLMLLLIVVLEVIYLTHNSMLASESVRAEEIKAEIAKLDEQNKILKSEVLSRSSLGVVASRAAEMGFEKPKEFISLKKNNSIALKHE